MTRICEKTREICWEGCSDGCQLSGLQPYRESAYPFACPSKESPRINRMYCIRDHLAVMAVAGMKTAYVNVFDGAYGVITHNDLKSARYFGDCNPKLQFRVKVMLK